MSIITSFSMFFLSFFPLWISVLFVDAKSIWEGNTDIYTEIISIGLILGGTLISLIILLFALNPRNADGAEEYTLIAAKEEKTITSEYLLSYILPLFAFDFTKWDELVLFGIFFAIFALLAIRHSHFSVNILLEIMQFRFYSCTLENEDGASITKTIITQKVLTAQNGFEIKARAINNEYFVHLSK